LTKSIKNGIIILIEQKPEKYGNLKTLVRKTICEEASNTIAKKNTRPESGVSQFRA